MLARSPASRRRRGLLLALALVTGGGLAPLLRATKPLARPIDCSNAIEVAGRLWCGERVPTDFDALCRGLGLPAPPAASPTPLRPGDAVDSARSCLVGRPPGRMAPSKLAALELPVNVNEADPAELASLPGVGPVTADRIVRARPFRRLSDLLRVRGIGPKRLAALRDRACVRWPESP